MKVVLNTDHENIYIFFFCRYAKRTYSWHYLAKYWVTVIYNRQRNKREMKRELKRVLQTSSAEFGWRSKRSISDFGESN